LGDGCADVLMKAIMLLTMETMMPMMKMIDVMLFLLSSAENNPVSSSKIMEGTAISLFLYCT
jgi:hypothetical protein